MPQYKLSYFDLAARGEPIRWLFLVAKVPFEDNRIQFPEWPEYKKKTTWGQLPILEVFPDGKQLAQWRSICRFLAKRFNMNGTTEWEHNKCDELADVLEDINTHLYKYIWEQDPLKKEDLKKNLDEVIFPTYLTKLNKIAKSVPGDFIVGKSITWADIALAASLKTWDDQNTQFLKPYPELLKLRDAVLALPEIKDYLKTRSIMGNKSTK